MSTSDAHADAERITLRTDLASFSGSGVGRIRVPEGVSLAPGQQVAVTDEEADTLSARVISVADGVAEVKVDWQARLNEGPASDARGLPTRPFVLLVPYSEGQDGVPQAMLTRSEFDPTRVYPGARVVLQDGEVPRPATVVRTELVWVDRPDHFHIRVAYILDQAGDSLPTTH